MSSLPASRPVDIAVLLSAERYNAALVERAQHARRLRGADMETLLGELTGKQVACAWPTCETPDWRRLVDAVAAAHRPRLFIVAGAAPRADASTSSGARSIRSVQAPGGPLTLPDVPRSVGEPVDLAADQAPWAFGLCSACLERRARTIGLAVLDQDRLSSDDPYWRRLAQQRSLAGKLGAVVGSVWRKPRFVAEAWEHMQRHWETQEELADAVERAVASFAD